MIHFYYSNWHDGEPTLTASPVILVQNYINCCNNAIVLLLLFRYMHFLYFFFRYQVQVDSVVFSVS